MNTSTISYAASPINPISLQAAVYFYEQDSYKNSYTIRTDGCKLSDGTQNCSRACTNVNNLFVSGSTFENCLSYPAVSNLLYTTNAPASVDAIEKYGFVPNDGRGSEIIVNTVSSCLKGWADTIPSCNATGGSCTGNDYGACSAFFTTLSDTASFPAANGSDPLSTSAFQCINTICTYVAQNAQVSADVGGIGVYISYLMQISFVLLCWLVIEYFRLVHPFLTRRLQKQDHTITKIHATRQKEIFVESVIDFHRAQSYFMSTILLAALIATQRGGLEAGSLQQVFNNLVLLSILAIGGSVPLMFMLFKLRLAGHRSWYTFTLSSITLLLACALAFSSGPHKSITNQLLAPVSSNIPSCGTIDPTMLCLQGYGNWQPGEGTTSGKTRSLYTENKTETIAAITLSLILWVVLLLDKIRKLGIHHWLGKGHAEEDEEADATEPSKKHRHTFLFRILFGIFDFVVCVCSLLLFVEYMKDLIGFGYGPTEWSFGQIIALTVWLPPLLQYLYLQLHGVEGNRWHLPPSLVVARKRKEDGTVYETRPGRGRVKNSVDLTALSLDRNSLDVRRASHSRARSHQRRTSRVSDRSVSRLRDEERRGSGVYDRSAGRLLDDRDGKNRTSTVRDIRE